MTAVRDEVPHPGVEVARDCTLVWIDARGAVIAHWRAGAIRLERLLSDVPPHHRATGHVRYDPVVRHGGSAPHDAGEANRLEHLARFVELVATRVPPEDEVLILGPGTVRDRLEHRIRETDRHASRTRAVTCQPAARSTDRQLAARLRELAGEGGRRHIAGAYRKTEPPSRRPSGAPRPAAPRVTRRSPIDIDDEASTEEEPG